MGSVEEGGLGARRTLLLVEASSSFPSALRISLLAIALLAALVSILRLLARRLIRVLAGLSGPIALSILLTILVGIILFVITSPKGRQHMTTEHTVVRSGKSKRKPFNSNVVAYYLLIIATFAFICAFAVVAPGMLFNAFAIFLAPAFCFDPGD